MDNRIHDTPSDVNAENGVVLVTGPGGVVVSLTPEAAAETSDRLLGSATAALGQRLLAEQRLKEIEDRRHPRAD